MARTTKAREEALKSEPAKIKYLIQTRTDTFVIELPAKWKITFASVNPASNMGRNDGYCVRVYEMPGSKLRAVFDSVRSIRDLSIPLARKVESEVGNSSWSRDSSGSFSESREATVNTEFVLEAGDADLGF